MSEALAEGEEELTDPQELVWRNVNPAWVDTDGRITSQAFRPTPKDHSKLSCARSTRVSAESHHMEFTEELQLASIGVWAVTVSESNEVGIRAVWDEKSIEAPEPCPCGHTYLDFRPHPDKKARRIGQRLRDAAEARGKRYPEIEGEDELANAS